MFLLPKKVSFLFFIFIFFTISSLFPTKQVFAQNKPSDLFNRVSAGSITQEEQQAQSQDKKDAVQVYDSRQFSRQLDLTTFHLGNKIACMYQDPKLCEGQPTALGAMAQLIGTIYANPPASGIAYTYDLLQHAGLLARPVYAQGIGFAGLTPLLSLWKATRNVAYAVLIIVMVAIGFMIIFRMKIDPKTVISVQAALPKIILTLVIITFSYAIVGFLIDMMYLVMAILISVIAKGMGPGFENRIAQLQTEYISGSWDVLFSNVFGAGINTFDDFLLGFGPTIVGAGAILSLATFNPIPIIISLGIPLLLAVFVLLGLLFTFIRLTLLLFNSYLQVLIALLLGPILLLTEAIPGQSAFTPWLVNIMANLVVFPTTVAILMFATFLATMGPPVGMPGIPYTNIRLGEQGVPLWTPPLLGAGPNIFSAFLALTVIFVAPTLVASVKKMFKAKPTLPITMGTAFSPITGTVSTGMGAMQSYYYMSTSLEHGILGELINKFKKPK